MEIHISLDEQTLRRYYDRGSPLFFGIYWSQDDVAYPDAYWMDFGAVICKPQNPLCSQCPQNADCEAYRHGLVSILPVKTKKIEKKNRWFYYFIIENDGSVYIHQRKGKDIWQNLYEFVLYESDHVLYQNDIFMDITNFVFTINSNE